MSSATTTNPPEQVSINIDQHAPQNEFVNQLRSQMLKLEENLSNFNELVRDTANQYTQIQSLGVTHASLIMASHKVIARESFFDDETSD